MSKKKKKKNSKKKLTTQLIKQLKKVIKVHGTELALGFVTGLVTQLIADKTKTPKKTQKSKKAPSKEQPTLATALEETTKGMVNKLEDTTKGVVNKVRAAVTPKTAVAKTAPARRVTTELGSPVKSEGKATA